MGKYSILLLIYAITLTNTSASPISLQSRSASYGIYRILGNDLPPRHSPSQTISNLEYILTHECEFPDTDKWWVLNRIVEQNVEAAIIDMLTKHKRPYLHIPFNFSTYQKIPYNLDYLPTIGSPEYHALSSSGQRQRIDAAYHDKNMYVMNNNGGRNYALQHGLARYQVTFPLDGNIFMTPETFQSVKNSDPHYPYILLPMIRVATNDQVEKQMSIKNYSDLAFFDEITMEEPQIGFRRNAELKFNENYRYGRRPKVS